MKKKTKVELDQLLQKRNEHPEKQAEIDQQIRETFCESHALFVLDMSGFSRMTIRYGIIHFLAMIHRMKEIVLPVLQEYDGSLVKQEADNIFAIFPDVKSALDAATDLLRRTAAVNTMLPDEKDIFLSIGIGYGEVLMIEDKDVYGSELNLTSKLGEDLARPSEILLTEAAFQQLETKPSNCEKVDFSISGLQLVAYQMKIS